MTQLTLLMLSPSEDRSLPVNLAERDFDFHHTLDGGLTEVVRIRLHGKPVNAHHNFLLAAFSGRIVRFAVAVYTFAPCP